jgi:hypothetical protein
MSISLPNLQYEGSRVFRSSFLAPGSQGNKIEGEKGRSHKTWAETGLK